MNDVRIFFGGLIHIKSHQLQNTYNCKYEANDQTLMTNRRRFDSDEMGIENWEIMVRLFGFEI